MLPRLLPPKGSLQRRSPLKGFEGFHDAGHHACGTGGDFRSLRCLDRGGHLWNPR